MDLKEWFEHQQRLMRMQQQNPQMQIQMMTLPTMMPLQSPMHMHLLGPQMSISMPLPSSMQIQTSMPFNMPPFQFNMGVAPMQEHPGAGCAMTYERITVSMPPQHGAAVEVGANQQAKVKVKELEDENKQVDMDLDESFDRGNTEDFNKEGDSSSQRIKLSLNSEYEAEKSLEEVKDVKVLDNNEEHELNGDHKQSMKKRKKKIKVKVQQEDNAGDDDNLPMNFEWFKPCKRPRAGAVEGKVIQTQCFQEKEEVKCSPRRTRQSSSRPRSTASTSKGVVEIQKELETVPPHMRASSKFQEEHLKREAQKILDIVNTDECLAYLGKVTKGVIQKDESMMMGGGLGPFTLFQDLQCQLLEILERFDVGSHAKYKVLLPEAIIYSLTKVHQCSRDHSLRLFAEQSLIVGRFEG